MLASRLRSTAWRLHVRKLVRRAREILFAKWLSEDKSSFCLRSFELLVIGLAGGLRVGDVACRL